MNNDELNELSVDQLNILVAKKEGYTVEEYRSGHRIRDKDNDVVAFIGPHNATSLSNYSPVTNWAQGGPIIERERIDLRHCQNGIGNHMVMAEIRANSDITEPRLAMAWGNTDLIAAMRCFVSLKQIYKWNALSPDDSGHSLLSGGGVSCITNSESGD